MVPLYSRSMLLSRQYALQFDFDHEPPARLPKRAGYLKDDYRKTRFTPRNTLAVGRLRPYGCRPMICRMRPTNSLDARSAMPVYDSTRDSSPISAALTQPKMSASACKRATSGLD